MQQRLGLRLVGFQQALRGERVEQLAQALDPLLGDRAGGEVLLDHLGDAEVRRRAAPEAGRVVGALDGGHERVAQPRERRALDLGEDDGHRHAAAS